MNMSLVFQYKKASIFIGLIVLIAVLAGFRSAFSSKELEFVTASRGSVVQEVLLTGKTAASDTVDLSFEQSGKVARVYVDVGAKVKAGQLLATLDSRETATKIAQASADVLNAQGQLLQYQSALDSARAVLQQLKRGPRTEDIDVRIAEVKSAEAKLRNETDDAGDVLHSAFVSADEAVFTDLDGVFANNNDQTSVRVAFALPNTQIKADLESSRSRARAVLDSLSAEALAFRASESSEDGRGALEALERQRAGMMLIRELLDLSMRAVIESSGLSAAQISELKSEVSNGRTRVTNAITALNTRIDDIVVAQSQLERSRSDLRKLQSGSSVEEISSQEAKVREAAALAESQAARVRSQNAILNSYNVQLSRYSLTAPFDGTVTKRSVVGGQNVVSSTPYFTMIAGGLLVVELNVPEIDIGKIEINNPAEMTIDAFPGEKFTGAVMAIEPAETVIDGVVNYKVKIRFTNQDPRLKSGLTANVRIETLRRENVIRVPEFVIIKRDDGAFVEVRRDGRIMEIKIERGARGADGYMEITAGIEEGDEIVNPKPQ